MNDEVRLLVTEEGSVDFAKVPDSALREVADKYRLSATEPRMLSALLRNLLLHADGRALINILKDLYEAAERHAAADAVVLTVRG
jgi:hypothetical protein